MAKKNETTVTKTKPKRSNPLPAPREGDHLLEWIAPKEDVTLCPEPDLATANLTQADVDAAKAKREAVDRVFRRADIDAVMSSPQQAAPALATTDTFAGLVPCDGWIDFDENQKPIAPVPIEAMRNAFTNSFDEALVSASQALREIGLLSRWSAVKIEKILDRVEQAVCCGDVATYDRLTGFRYARDEQTLGMILTTRGDVDDWCIGHVAGFISTTPRELPAIVIKDGYPEVAPSEARPICKHVLANYIWQARALSGAKNNSGAIVWQQLREIALNQPLNSPFTGSVTPKIRKDLAAGIKKDVEASIWYTDDNGDVTAMTVAALRKRLKNLPWRK